MTRSNAVTWVLEHEVAPELHARLKMAVQAAGHGTLTWDDEWWSTGRWPKLDAEPVIFHGSLGNAARIGEELNWSPGAWCNTSAFYCSQWFPRARRWLLHERWEVLTAERLVADPETVLERIGAADAVFVRPDSPLKPFSGRVLARDQITLQALDHGFYYDDAGLPIVVAPVRQISGEWRYVIGDSRVVAGSAYMAETHRSLPDDPRGAPWQFAEEVAAQLEPPEDIYVLDVCQSGTEYRLLELNPFSGADLYACDLAAVVMGASAVSRRTFETSRG